MRKEEGGEELFEDRRESETPYPSALRSELKVLAFFEKVCYTNKV